MLKKILGAALVLATAVLLAGCIEKAYEIDCGGKEDMYYGAHKTYRAGEKVTLCYSHIASDTDYSFYVDGKSAEYIYDEDRGYVLTFIMPEHDVRIECIMKNSMEYDV